MLWDDEDADGYPKEARHPSGVLWWKVPSLGFERKLAAWLFFNKQIEETFTLREIRQALGNETVPAQDEHANRRLRNLRPDGWVIPSNLDDRSLGVGEYRLMQKGWFPGQGPRPNTGSGVSANTRREVLVRDGSRCKVCGVGDGEPYPGEPGTKARMTIGHRIPRARGGSNNPDNLRAECQRCNEPSRNTESDPDTFEEVLPALRNLRRDEKDTLISWLLKGERERSKLDVLYDRLRKLSPTDIRRIIDVLRKGA